MKLPRVIYFQMMVRCWQLAGRAGRPRMVLVYLLFGCANGMIVLQPVITAHIISTLAAGGAQMLDRLLLWLAAMVGVMLLFWFFNGMGRAVEQAFAARLRQMLTLDLYRKLTVLPWEWHQVHHSGETLNKVTTAGKAVYSFANNQFWYLQVYLRLIGSLIGLLVLAPIVGLSVTASIPLVLSGAPALQYAPDEI